MQFTSTNASAFSSFTYETPILTCRLTELLAGEVSLKKTVLTFEEMERAAECAGVIPLYLNITDGRGNITEKVQLNKEKKGEKWTIPRVQFSSIQYIHLYTMPKEVPSITVKNFLQRGFPSKKDAVDCNFLLFLAQQQDVILKKLIITSDNTSAKEYELKSNLGEIEVPNKKRVNIIYDVRGSGGRDLSVRLDNLLSSKVFPEHPINILTFVELEGCFEFQDIVLSGFQSDKQTTDVQPLQKDNFIEYPYSNSKRCFVYFIPPTLPEKLRSVRLDHLLERKRFPYVPYEDEDDLSQDIHEGDDHAPVHDVIDDHRYLSMVKDIHDFLYSFEEKVCGTCNNRWFVTKKQVPGNVCLDVLDRKKNRFAFQYSNFRGSESDRCAKDIPNPGLPKLFFKKITWTLVQHFQK